MFKIFKSFYSGSFSFTQNIGNEQSKEIKTIVNSTISNSNINNPIEEECLSERVKSKMESMLGIGSFAFGGIASGSKKAVKAVCNYPKYYAYDFPRHYIKGEDSLLKKTEMVANAKTRMDQIDVQLGEIHKVILTLAKDLGNKYYPELCKVGYGLSYILPQQQYFIDILEINFSKIFVNLINQVESERLGIPNFDHQPMWFNVIVFLCRDFQKEFSQRLFSIEKEYRSDLEELEQLKQELFPTKDDAGKIDLLMEQFIASKDWDKRVEAALKLFPDEPISFHTAWDLVEDKKIQDFLNLLLAKDEYVETITDVFSQFSARILEKFLPVADFELPKFYKGFIVESVLNSIESQVTTFLTDSFLSDKKFFLDQLSLVEFGINQLNQLPTIHEKRNALKNACGGGELFCNLSKTISSDLVNQISKKIIHKEKTLQEILAAIDEETPSKEMIKKMENYLDVFIESKGLQELTPEAIAEIYFKSFGVNPHPIANNESLKLLTKQYKNSLSSFEKIAGNLQKALPDYINFESFIFSQLKEMLQGDSDSFKKNREFTQQLVEGLLLNLFTEIASKNPATPEKSTEVIFIENAFNLFSDFYFAASNGQKGAEDISKEFTQILVHDLLGLDKFLPPFLLEMITDYSNSFLSDLQNHFSKITSNQTEIIQVKEDLKQFGVFENSEKSTAEVLINDLMAMVLPAVLDSMTVIPEKESEIAGVNLISNQVQALIESYVSENFETAKVFFDYADKATFKNILKGQFLALNDPKFSEDKNKIVENLSNFLLLPLNQLIKKTIHFGGHHQKESLQKVMGSIFSAGASHFDLILKAKKLAALHGRDHILHEDILAVGDNLFVEKKLLHPAVPRQHINYQKTIDLIKKIIPDLTSYQEKQLQKMIKKMVKKEKQLQKMIKKMVKKEKLSQKYLDLEELIKGIRTVYQKELTNDQKTLLMKRDENHENLIDVIKAESSSHSLQRNEQAFKAASQVMLRLMFPNGLQDLIFVPEAQRQSVWNLLEGEVLPIVFPIIVELLIDPVMINKTLLKIIEKKRDAFKADIDVKSLNQPKQYNIKSESQLEAEILLGKSSGELVASLMNLLELPPALMKMIIDPKTGNVSLEMQEILANSLVEVFNEEFISSTLTDALAFAVERDKETGNFALKYNGPAEKVNSKENRKVIEELKVELKKTAREAIKAGLFNMIRTMWAKFQVKLDNLFSVFGKLGISVKFALDAICRFVFFKMIGSILSVILHPVSKMVETIMYNWLALDKNLDILSGLFGDLPEDQPEGYEYAVYNENLVYQMVQAVNEAVLAESDMVKEVVEKAMNQK